MHASTPRSPSEAAPTRPRHLRHDEQGVSEVIGYLLVFGILSIVLVLSMGAFAVGQEAAQSRAVQLRAESAAARVAGVVVQTAVLWEQQGSGFAVAYLVDLPQQLEGRDYVVRLEAAATTDIAGDCTVGSHPEQVCVEVASLDIQASAPIFAAGAPLTLAICDGPGTPAQGYTTVAGGALNVRINRPVSGSPAIPAGCDADEIFLEAT